MAAQQAADLAVAVLYFNLRSLYSGTRMHSGTASHFVRCYITLLANMLYLSKVTNAIVGALAIAQLHPASKQLHHRHIAFY